MVPKNWIAAEKEDAELSGQRRRAVEGGGESHVRHCRGMKSHIRRMLLQRAVDLHPVL